MTGAADAALGFGGAALSPAPFHRLAGDPPAAARAVFTHAADGTRLRLALWPAADPARGTLLLFPGRTEYLEKYDAAAGEFAAAGWHVLGMDWRGQGLSDRLLADPRPGHVEDFAAYQQDVAALTTAAGALELPRPWSLLAHSMGGGIGLGALAGGLQVERAIFSAPMWGILHKGVPRRVVDGLVRAARRLGRAGTPAAGTGGGVTFVLDCAFRDNLLTGDGQRWGRMVAEAAAWPELTLGGATYGWLGAALAECDRLAALPSPGIPALVSLGTAERIVSPAAIRARVARWPRATLHEIAGGQHEALFETPPRRDAFLTAALDFLVA